MSGFNPSDLARWAMGGGANINSNEEEQDTAENTTTDNQAAAAVPMSVEQLREQRLARMSQLNVTTSNPEISQQQDTTAAPAPEPSPMQTDEEEQQQEKPTLSSPSIPQEPPASTPRMTSSITKPSSTMSAEQKSQKSAKEASPGLQQRRIQRKKELLIKKILQVTLVGGVLSTASPASDNSVEVDIGSTEISVETIAEILAARLSSNSSQTKKQPLMIAYLGKAHLMCVQESALSNRSSSDQANSPDGQILEELQNQIASYAATCIIEPDLFPNVSTDIPKQLTDALIGQQGDLFMSPKGFYGKLVDELDMQSPDTLRLTVAHVVNILLERLQNSTNLLESTDTTDPFSIAAAFSKLCSKKIVAEIVTELEVFLLPSAGSAEANQVIRPTNLSTTSLQQFLAHAFRPYAKRSGPGLERHTILGALLKVGLPRAGTNGPAPATSLNPAFPPSSVLRQSPATVGSLMRSQRQQLHTYQQTVFAFVKSLLKAGPAPKSHVMQWIKDALLVNTGASALRPDSSKVSSGTLLMNLTVLLLELCAPFVGQASKQDMIHSAFVSSETHHSGVFATVGDDAVVRLGGEGLAIPYNPRNTFVPSCFFFCARSLHYSVVALLSQYENLMRHAHHLHQDITSAGNPVHTDGRFAQLISRQRSEEVSLFADFDPILRFCDFLAKVLNDYPDEALRTMPEDFCSDICAILLGLAQHKPKLLQGASLEHVFRLVVKLLSPHYASVVRNYNLRAQLGDVLYEIFLPEKNLVGTAPNGQAYLLSASAQESLAPSLLLLYGEVEHCGYYEKMSYRAKIASLLKYLWDSSEHRPAFRRIASDTDSFIVFANGIMNETNNLISTIMQKLPEIREAQETMRNADTWGSMTEEEQNDLTGRLEENERHVTSSLPLCNKTLQMFGYLNTDGDIRKLFLLDELCPRLVKMLVHVLIKLVGSRGMELKVDNPEQYEFRPKELLRDLCAIFALFSGSSKFQEECARSECDPQLLRTAVKTCRKYKLLSDGESLESFALLPDAVVLQQRVVMEEENLLQDAPGEFLDPILSTFMKDPVRLPSGNTMDRSTIAQHLLNDPTDPYSRDPLSIDDLVPDTELQARMQSWLENQKKKAAASKQQETTEGGDQHVKEEEADGDAMEVDED